MKKYKFLLITLITYSICLFVIAVMLNIIEISQHIHSDVLYLPAFCRDIIDPSYSIKGWFITPAPYFFPDMLSICAFYGLTGDVGISFAFHLLIFFSVIIALLIYGDNLHSKTKLSKILFTISSISLFLFVLLEPKHRIIKDALFFPSMHSGTILNGIILIVLCIKFLKEKGRKTWTYFLIGLICCLAALSDKLFISQFLGPAIATFFIFLIAKKISWQSFIKYIFSSISGIIISELIQYLITVFNYLSIPSINPQLAFYPLETIKELFINFYEESKGFINTGNWITITLFAWIVTSPIIFWIFHKIQLKQKSEKELDIPFIIVFSYISIISTIVIPVYLKIWDGVMTLRHMLVLATIPWFFFTYSLLRIELKNRPHLLRIILSLIFLFLSSSILYENHSSLKTLHQQIQGPYIGDIECLDQMSEKYQINRGLGDYWQAKYVSLLSKNNLQVDQIYGNLSRIDWISNPNWYSNKKEYNFIISNGIKIDLAIAKLGEPDHIEVCEKVGGVRPYRHKIYIYRHAFSIDNLK